MIDEEEQLQENTTKSSSSAQETAHQLLNGLKKGKETHDIFATSFRNSYTISGKTIKQWEDYFKISVPENPDPATCKMLDMHLMDLHQEASFFHAAVSAYGQALRKGSDSEYRARYTALVTEYQSSGKKLPARGTLEDLVRAETDSIESAVVNADIQKEFWKNIMDHLNMCRRLLENATINSGIEAKLNPGSFTAGPSGEETVHNGREKQRSYRGW